MTGTPTPSTTQRGRGAASRIRAALVFVCAALVLLPATASARHHATAGVRNAAGTLTTIGFDDLGDGTALSDQYAAQGVSFINGTSIPGYAGCCFPVVTAAPQAHSGANAISAYRQCRPEFCTPGIAGKLTSFASFVRVFVGSLDGQGSATRTVTLTAYDSSLQQLGQQTTTGLADSVSTQLEVDAPSQEIAYFTVQANDYNTPLGIDDLSFDVPTSPPPPDFQLGASSTLGIYAYPGIGGSASINIQRFNGSTGPIQFSASGLPSGWSASFDPNPATGGDGTTKATITPGPNATTGSATNVVINADPQSPDAGATQRQITLPVNVNQPIGLSSTTTTLTGCQSAASLNLTMQSAWTQPVDISVVKPSSASVSPSHIDPDGSFGHPFSLHVAGTGQVVLRLTSGSYSADVPVTVDSDLSVGSVNSGRSYGDQRDILITGSGFCTGIKVQIGAQPSFLASTPDWVSSDGARMTVPISLLATTGPATVSTDAASATSSGTVFVDGYRNTNAFSFHNYIPHITFDQLTQAFGHDQTYDCLGVDACFRDPWAIIVSAIADTAFDGSGGGACFGFSLASLRIYSGSLAYTQGKLVDQFPHAGGANVFGIDPAIAAGGSDGPINEYINAMQASQLSNEFLGHYLSDVVSHIAKGGAASAQDVYGEINDSLHATNADFPIGTYPLIALREGTSGHVVVAYGLEGTPSDYYIDVYDSNRPYQGEATDGNAHAKNVLESRIHVDSAGHWSLLSSSMTGDMAGLVVTRPTDLPKFNPTMIGSGLVEQGAAAILFASAGSPQTGTGSTAPPASKVTQLTDGAGHTMFDASGHLNTDAATRLSGTPFAPLTGAGPTAAGNDAAAPFILVPQSTSTLHETVSDTGTGADSHMLIDHGTAAEIDTQASAGASDQLTLTPGSGSVGFATDASRKPLALTLTDRVASRSESATVTTTSYHGGADSISFAGAAQGLVIHHRGPATKLAIKLAVSGGASVPSVFESTAIRVPANGTASVPRIAWGSLGGATLRVRVGNRTRLIANRLGRLPRVSIRSLRATLVASHSVVLTVRLAHRRIPRGAQISFQWVVRHGTSVVATQTVLASRRTRTASYTFTGQGAGYTVTATATPVRTVGITEQAARPAARTLGFTG